VHLPEEEAATASDRPYRDVGIFIPHAVAATGAAPGGQWEHGAADTAADKRVSRVWTLETNTSLAWNL
jgi:hypothetical protein